MFRNFLVMGALIVSPARSADEPKPWTTEPDLRMLQVLVERSMFSYSDWSDEFRQSGRHPSSADWTVNSMTEELFIKLLEKMGDHPEPDLLQRSLIFLGEKVPPEFDDLWRMVFLELSSNIDRKIGEDAAVEHKAKGLKTLLERAMKKDEPKP